MLHEQYKPKLIKSAVVVESLDRAIIEMAIDLDCLIIYSMMPRCYYLLYLLLLLLIELKYIIISSSIVVVFFFLLLFSFVFFVVYYYVVLFLNDEWHLILFVSSGKLV